jgi:hypothetical protein
MKALIRAASTSSSIARTTRQSFVVSAKPRSSNLASQLRSPNADRYITIHNFFTRQATLPTYTQARFSSTKPTDSCEKCSTSPEQPPPHVQTPPGHAQDYTPFIRRLIGRSQSLTTSSPTRPTKEQLLAAAGSWWERLRVRLKWFTIRGWRRFNADDYGAFASVFVLGNSKFILRSRELACSRRALLSIVDSDWNVSCCVLHCDISLYILGLLLCRQYSLPLTPYLCRNT